MTQSAPRIAVLVSIGRHPVSGEPRWSRNDARALDLAYSLAASPADVDVIHAGQAEPDTAYGGSRPIDALRDYLALGVKSIQVLDVAPGTDIVPILAERVQHAAVIICGMRAEGQDDSGMVPYLLARKINARLLPGALELSRSGNTIAAVQFLPKGRRRRIEAAMPCVVTAHPLAPLGLKYAHANKLAGHIRSEEHTSELQSLMRTSYAVFC